MKTLAAHPSCFFPGLEVFYKWSRADVFVVADDVQFVTHGDINRARIKSAAGATWLTVPVRHKGLRRQPIRQVAILQPASWRRRHLKSIAVNYKASAYFEKYIDFFEGFYRKRWERLRDINFAGLEFAREALGIRTPMRLSSEFGIDSSGSQRIIDLAQALDCSRYLTDTRSRSYLDASLFQRAGIELAFFEYSYPVYHQLFGEFLPGLSIIDLLFNEGDAAPDILMKI